MCRATQCERKLHVIHLYGIVYVYAISSTLTDHKFCASQSRTHFVWITNRLCSHIMNSAAFSEFNVAISMFFFLFRFFHSHWCVCVFVRVVFFSIFAQLCLRFGLHRSFTKFQTRKVCGSRTPDNHIAFGELCSFFSYHILRFAFGACQCAQNLCWVLII